MCFHVFPCVSMCFCGVLCEVFDWFSGRLRVLSCIMAPKLRVALAVVAMVNLVFVAPLGGMCDTVSIENDMGHGVALGVQCTSRTKLLGFQTIRSGLMYMFYFRPSWWGRDMYKCNFQAKGFPLKQMRVYEGINFLGNFCLCSNCHWKVSPKGFDCENGQYHETWQ